MKPYLLSLLFYLFIVPSSASIKEPVDPKKPKDNTHWDQIKKSLYFSFVDADYSLSKHHYPAANQTADTWQGEAWKNETIHTQLAFWSNLPAYNGQDIQLKVSDLKSGKSILHKENITFTPISYVLSDDPSNLKSGCGISIILDSTLVADRIQNTNNFTYTAYETRPLWLSIKIPSAIKAGIYKGTVELIIGKGKGKKELSLPYSVTISNRTLPLAMDWDFHLDLWQNPYSSARYYDVTPFTAEHFKLIEPHMLRLAHAGQKNITASIIHDPWNSQTFDKYGSMIQWTKKKNGTWEYDYTNFDKWVEFMHHIGIDKYINCYSMIPWNLSFYYFDEETNKTEILKASPNEDIYKNHWHPFLKDFAQHLKEKGWFNKTTIAMDERPMKDMQAATSIIKAADKDYNISLAGYYHPELSDDIIDYSIPFHADMSSDILASRKAKGYKTTMYTCCTEIFPNTLTSSGYYEPIWLMLNTVERGFDGYLRWSFDNWNKSPFTDTRFGPFSAGDTYLVYPDNETSIRFENMIDGIQQIEKIKILRKAYENNTDSLNTLESHIKKFSNKEVKRDLIPIQVKSLKKSLNSL
ncbi:DUF4091 domain-containing protein [Sphingobacterium rhinopitheci]|uniref:DUF4091 domain-containing protein n=1 Tax=Sphingobacterium rhinopitheci TaxID=2781960 RepID=UPI001F529A2C|nr:glycoside hydrolase domain-containing protein [Sphingobacterium rhinopitheci]MCI0920477.1 DUF4091 domain-containing protein [Sphingobacterium rhinopitheci]